MNCPLCFSGSREFFVQETKTYYECNTCKGIFVGKEHLPEPEAEKERYLTHNNDIDDPRYQEFVSPIVNAVISNFNPEDHVGLDFGAGTGPVITRLLRDLHYKVFAYDPFFLPYPQFLERSYDFIACCEVIEHFQNPAKEFELLKSMLLPGGKLFCMTHIYDTSINFSTWYYKNDPTHIFIYQQETFNYILAKFNFTEVKIKKRLITLSF